MLELIGVDGLTQWDVGRQVKVDKDINMVHFSNRPYGYSKNVKVTDGVADVPDMFLTSCAPLHIWAYIGNFEKGYTKIEKIYEIKPKNRPEDYIYTPEEVKTWEKLQSEIGDLAKLETEAKENIVAAINEVAANMPSGGVALDTTLTQSGQAADAKAVGDALAEKQPKGDYLTQDNLQSATDAALAQAKASGEFDGADGAPGKDGADGVGIQSVVQTTTSTEDGGTNVVTVTKTDGTSSTFSVKNGSKGSTGQAGANGADGKTPYVGDNGNWYIGADDTGKPSRGAKGEKGDTGAQGIQGEQGIQGVQGEKGDKGEKGAKGDKGDTGATPNLTIGSVTTLDAGQNATANMSGTAESPVLNLGIPRGTKGEPGSLGAPGADGKSAYQYAQEGGYTGTETEFAEKLAQEQLTGTTNDLTPTQVYNAVSAGIPVKVQYTDSTYGLLSFTAFNVAESLDVIVSQTIVYYNSLYILAELFGNKSNNIWGFNATTLAQKTDIPSALPNPNALTLTGAVNATYDGSTAVTVNIPSAVTDDHINSLIDTKLGVIENGSY